MRGYSAIGLISPRREVNIGGVMRAAFCYEAALVLIEKGCRYTSIQDTPKAWKHMPVVETEDLFKSWPVDCVPVAVDLVEGAVDLRTFNHPDRACYVFGPENGTLGERVLSKCVHRVMIPTRVCMNLAATVNVVLYDRLLKQCRSEERNL